MKVDTEAGLVSMRVVYYGPALAGKTTNLRALQRLLPPGQIGRLITLESRDQRTLLLDLLPMVLHTRTQMQVRVRLLAVPGQQMHSATRKVLLKDVDAIIFVADSQRRETSANNASYRVLTEQIDPDMPLIIQFNKRDLPDVRSDAELAQMAMEQAAPVLSAVALQGIGVRESLATALRLIWRRHAQRLDLPALLGVDEDEFLHLLVREAAE
jgi:signal recognition particle receptor subunit beta